MHRYLRIRKFIEATILYAKLISIPTNKIFDKSFRYIHDDKSWERCCVILNILFPSLRFLRLAYSNHAGMEKVYYYSRMTKQCIEKKISDIDYQKLFLDISSPANICNKSDDKSDKEESLPNDCNAYLDNICFFISKLWN